MSFDAEPKIMNGHTGRSMKDSPQSLGPASRKPKLGVVKGGCLRRTADLIRSSHIQDLPCMNFSNIHQDQGVGTFEALYMLFQIQKLAHPDPATLVPTGVTRITAPILSSNELPAASNLSVEPESLRGW